MTVSSPRSSAALWHAQAHMPTVLERQLVIVSGDGAYITTDTGHRLLDATAGLWHANVGHGREELALAAYEQIKRLETFHIFGRFANDRALELADRVTELGPISNAKAFWTSGGSDSIDTACKLARRHWQLEGLPQKRVILSRELAYHGLHAFGTSITGLSFNREGYGTESLVPETARVPTLDVEGTRKVIESVGPENIAAIVAEPIIGTGGVIAPSDGYLVGIQGLAREHDILFIADEVITGFGRAGRMFASERFGIEPDMLVLAKGITSGYQPLGGVLVAPRIWERFFSGPDAPMFRHGLTYSGHATACAVAMANLDIVERERLPERAATLEVRLREAVAPLAEHPAVIEVRVGGFMAGVQLREDVDGESVADRCIGAGVATRVITANTLQICPPLVVSVEEVDLIAETIQAALLDAV